MSESKGGEPAVEALAAASASITYGEIPDRADMPEADLARRLRLGLDYLRYLDPFYDEAPLRRVRARERTPRGLINLADPPMLGGEPWRRRIAGWLHALDLAIAPPPGIVDYLREQAPDVLLLTPLVDLGSKRSITWRACPAARHSNALAVWSWDHLSARPTFASARARLRPGTERSSGGKRSRCNGVPADRVVVTARSASITGSARASRDRWLFSVALPPADRPMVLYVCTGLIMAVHAPGRRSSASAAASAGQRRSTLASPACSSGRTPGRWTFASVDLGDLGPVAIWGGNPVDNQPSPTTSILSFTAPGSSD